MPNYQDLETKGFLVIKNFFSNELVSTLIDDYKSQKELFLKFGGNNKNYGVINSRHFLSNNLAPLLQEISRESNITVNITRPFSAYFDNNITNFGWHQDHEPYYIFQDMYNAINCWIPIIKADKSKGGLGILPNDVLESRCPDLFKNQLLGRGAKSFKILEDHTTLMNNDDIGGSTILPFNIDELAVYPDMSPGDLLVLRQDVIHKTQDTSSERVSVSVRCLNSNTILTKKHFLSGPDKKKEMINKNQSAYSKLIKKFVDEDIETISIYNFLNNI